MKSLQLWWCGHVERMQKQRMPKQIATAAVEGAWMKEHQVEGGGTWLIYNMQWEYKTACNGLRPLEME
jgi:hypothetical protein